MLTTEQVLDSFKIGQTIDHTDYQSVVDMAKLIANLSNQLSGSK